MARPGKIWENKAKGGWYATLGGRKVRLSEDKQEAERLYAEHKAKQNAPELKDCNRLKTIFNLYLDHLSGTPNYAPVKLTLQSFSDHHPTLRVADLRAVHVHQWWNAHQWADGTKRLYTAQIVACLNWACKPENRYTATNPIAGLWKPPENSRGEEALVTQADHERLVAAANPALADYLEALRHTGTRPSTLFQVTAEDVDFSMRRIKLEKHKMRKKTGKPVYLPMTSKLVEICKRLCEKHPTGCIFRNVHGRAWNYINFRSQVEDLAERCGIKFYAYMYRHSLATELLTAGMPDAHVAQILNHKDTKMIYHHYSHLGGAITKFAEAMDRIIGCEAQE